MSQVQVVISRRGSSVQRNTAMSFIDPRCDIVCFLDDDVELEPRYFEHLLAVFDDTGTVLASGAVVLDGKIKDTVSREQAKRVIAGLASHPCTPNVTPIRYAYGCNMAVRFALLREVRFDERLPLYGWLEDLDFSYQAGLRGRVVQTPRARLVHLGEPAGRVSGAEMGFSQIINPLYLFRKGSLPSLYEVLVKHWAKQLIANTVLTVIGDKHVDRVGRLRGNLLAFRMILKGRVDPEYVPDWQ